MGKVAGAALKIAAPEAAVAAKAAGKAPGAKKAPVPDPRQTRPGSDAARQRQAVEDVKAARKPEPEPEDQAGEPSSSTASPSAPFAGMQGPATGGGVVLGLLVWAVVRAYIGNPGQPSGVDGVKRLMAAKFLNKTSAPSQGG